MVNSRGPKRKRRLSEAQLQALAEIVETGPDPEVDGVVRWRRVDLQRLIEKRFKVVYCERTISKLSLGAGQDEAVMAAFKKTSPIRLRPTPQTFLGKVIEIWFQDEARLGQKNPITRSWARKGTRPRQPADQRYQNAYLFGAICPKMGKGAALMLPFSNTAAMQIHLNEISRHVAPKAHGVVLMDRAGWHTTGKLNTPKNITIILLPSRAPELNPVENIWQYIRSNWLSNRVFDDYEAILDAGCEAWNKLLAQPETIKSIGMRDWAHEVNLEGRWYNIAIGTYIVGRPKAFPRRNCPIFIQLQNKFVFVELLISRFEVRCVSGLIGLDVREKRSGEALEYQQICRLRQSHLTAQATGFFDQVMFRSRGHILRGVDFCAYFDDYFVN